MSCVFFALCVDPRKLFVRANGTAHHGQTACIGRLNCASNIGHVQGLALQMVHLRLQVVREDQFRKVVTD